MTSFDADFRCEVIAFEDGERPLLVLEDLSHAHWPPPWEPGEVECVLATLERMWSLPVPGHLPDASGVRKMFGGWQAVAADPEGFLGLGLASPDWLVACLETLLDAASSASFEGDDFLHMDVRSENLCITGDRVVLVDWNWAVHGPRELDLAWPEGAPTGRGRQRRSPRSTPISTRDGSTRLDGTSASRRC